MRFQTWHGFVLGALIALGATTELVRAESARFDRYFGSVNRCGVIGYCKTTASDVLLRGPTSGRSDPFIYLRRRDACDHGRRWHGSTCRVQYVPRGAIPKIYVDFEPGDIRVPSGRRAMSAKRSKHVEWCAERYRSYRLADNTFQPNEGGRRACNSPFE
jgi:hypothetical protein